MEPVDVAIIGAGLAGIAAASDCVMAGKRVVLIDKARGLGGRMATRRYETTRIDHGAQFFTARTQRFKAIVADLCLTGTASVWSSGFPILRDSVITEREASHPRYACAGGMSDLAKSLLAEGTPIRLGTQVTSIEIVRGPAPTTEQYAVLSGATTLCFAHSIILNMPPAQLMHVAGNLLNAGEIRVLEELEMEPCWAIGGILQQDIALGAPALECDHPVLSWVSRNHTRRFDMSAPLSVVIHTNGAWSKDHLEDEPSAVLHAVEQAMEAIGLPIQWKGLPFVHRWRFAKPVCGLKTSVFCVENHPSVFGVGDWCLGGRVEGAICSGWSAAELVLSHCIG